MEIPEAQARAIALEKELTRIVSEFEAETGATISDVRLVSTIGERKVRLTVNIR